MKTRLLIGLLLFWYSQSLAENTARDSVRLRLSDAEELFLQKNFALLAAKSEVSVADAAIIQARLFQNPTVYYEHSVKTSLNGNLLIPNPTQEQVVQVQKLFLLGGKRTKQIGIANLNSQVAQFTFYDLARNLKYELHSAFYGLYFARQSIAVYDREIESLRTLINVYTDQYKKGNIAFKELARIQALQFSLENERIDILKDASEKQGNLLLLTGDTISTSVNPVVDSTVFNSFNPITLTYTQLLDSAHLYRYDLRTANTMVDINERTLSLQKALRVPDITLGANYDHAGNYIYNYTALSLSIPIPIFNRNQGNVKIAQYKAEESKVQLNQAELQVRNDISKAYSQLLETDRLYKTASGQFNSDYEKLLDGIMKAYQSHTISLLEFIDYYETYKNSKIEYNKLQNNRFDAIENLNLATGTTIIK